MTASWVLAAVLALAAFLAGARLLHRWWRLAPPARPRVWRLLALLSLQPLAAMLLYLTLLPPPVDTAGGTMTVVTAGGAVDAGEAAGEVRILLPEAGPRDADAAAERVPDLATALRRYPGTSALRVVGAGLGPRDREAARGHALRFDPAPLPDGFVHLAVPQQVAVGDRFGIGGTVHGVAGGQVELLDPAGQRVDLASLDGEGGFVLAGTAREAGPADFRLRLYDAGHGLREELPVPLWTTAEPPPRILLLAGAASPELKYLRRWAADAGMAPRVRVAVGGGLQFGEAAVAIDAAGLRGFDLVVVDDRAWAALGPRERGALVDAVDGGLGLLLRATGPLPGAVRRQWHELGFELAPSAASGALRMPPAVADADPDQQRARAGAGSRDAPAIEPAPVPELAQPGLRLQVAEDTVPLLRDASGTTLAAWRTRGQGRIGLWLPSDSFRLVLSGHRDLHAELWSDAFAALARSREAAMPRLPAEAREQQRLVLCGLHGEATVVAPDGGISALLPDPATGEDRCAGYWPRQPGWHRLRDGQAEWPFHVRAADEAAGLRAEELREATLRLAGEGVDASAGERAGTPPPRRGPSWPWFLAWLSAMALLWWLERSRLGRREAAG